MAVFAIADLHLPAQTKPMDVFGPHWKDHFQRIRQDWSTRVSPEDLVLLPGDISWAMRLEEALEDLHSIGSLPGTKVLLRGDGSNVYFADKYYKPIGIYQFNAASGSTKKIVSLSEPAYGKANIVEFYEEGIGVKLYNTGEMQYDAVTVYDHSGASVAGNANEYVCEYDGERVYSANGESVESWRADGGKVYNSDFDFTVETSPFAGGNVMQVYTYHGKEFIELYYQNRYIIITRVGDTYKEIAEVESTCYLDGSSLYYIKSGNILKIDLSGGDYKATTFCKADASYIYYITGNHVCYGKTSKNGAHFTAYSMDVGSKAVKLVDSDCPMDGI